MRTIGTVVRLQVQRGSLKRGEKPTRVYDPAPLLAVPALSVSPDGALGVAASDDETWIVDIHHRMHPHTKNEDGLHGISIGFTSHYDAMREHFGDKVSVGCAGENIIAQAERRFTYDEVAGGIAILSPDGAERVRLRVLQVAHPCRPFTGWALGKTVEPEELKKHLQFLDNGMRGFYCAGEGTGTVKLGDSVAVL